MNTSRKTGPAPIKSDDPRLKAFQPGPMTEKTKQEIAEHRARYLAARQQRSGDAAPAVGPVTVRDPISGAVIIRPIPDLRFSGDAPSGLMPFDSGSDE